jgi:hypothetical protein
VTLWSLRIPHLCFFLAGAPLIYSLLRSVTGKSAANFGALCWISMPVVAPKFIRTRHCPFSLAVLRVLRLMERNSRRAYNTRAMALY